jgi:hypothetical protein
VGPIALPVRPEPQGLHDPPDPPLPDQLSGPDRAAHLEALREGHRPETTGLRDRVLDLAELIERDAAGLVRDDVLAVHQGLDRDGRAPVRYRRGDDQVDGGIPQQARGVVRPPRVGPATANLLRHRGGGVVGAEADELAALPEQPLDLPEGMRVVQADGGEPHGSTALVRSAHC